VPLQQIRCVGKVRPSAGGRVAAAVILIVSSFSKQCSLALACEPPDGSKRGDGRSGRARDGGAKRGPDLDPGSQMINRIAVAGRHFRGEIAGLTTAASALEKVVYLAICACEISRGLGGSKT